MTQALAELDAEQRETGSRWWVRRRAAAGVERCVELGGRRTIQHGLAQQIGLARRREAVDRRVEVEVGGKRIAERRRGAGSPDRAPRSTSHPAGVCSAGSTAGTCGSPDRRPRAQSCRARDLQLGAHPLDAVLTGGVVRAGAVQHGGIEETQRPGRARSAPAARRTVPSLQVVARPGNPARTCAVGEQHRRPRLDRHIDVGHGALQGEHGRQRMDVHRVALCLLIGHEAEVVVAVGRLWGNAAGVDHVELGGHLVRRLRARRSRRVRVPQTRSSRRRSRDR